MLPKITSKTKQTPISFLISMALPRLVEERRMLGSLKTFSLLISHYISGPYKKCPSMPFIPSHANLRQESPQALRSTIYLKLTYTNTVQAYQFGKLRTIGVPSSSSRPQRMTASQELRAGTGAPRPTNRGCFIHSSCNQSPSPKRCPRGLERRNTPLMLRSRTPSTGHDPVVVACLVFYA
jgi:hypothetical protein